MPRTVLAVYRFVVDDDVTDEQVDDLTTAAYTQFSDVELLDRNGHEYHVSVYELTCSVVVGKAMP